jgi:hypothetical protein
MVTENSNVFKLPEFPTLFTPEDEARKQELEKQKQAMLGIYQQKFATNAPSAPSPPEAALRKFVQPTFLSKIARVLTPADWGYDYGMTPDEAQKRLNEVSTELQELNRKEQVTNLIEPIQNTLRMLALSGEAVTSTDELNQLFKLDQLGFTDEEKAYLATYARSMLTVSSTTLAEGETVGLKPLTQKELDLISRSPDLQTVDPRFILSTVAFSKNVDDIVLALREAYPTEQDLVTPTTKEDEILKSFNDLVKGTTGEAEVTGGTKDTANKIFTYISDNLGIPKTLVDSSTGNVYNVVAKPAFSSTELAPLLQSPDQKNLYALYYNDEFVSLFNKSTGELYLNDVLGRPAITTNDKQNMITGLVNAAHLAIDEASMSTIKALSSTLPQAFLDIAEDISPSLGTLGGEKKQTEAEKAAQKATIDDWKNYLQGVEDSVNRDWSAYLISHPELQPRTSWTESPTKNPGVLKDPGWIAYHLVNMAPLMGTSLVIGGLTTALAGPLAGATVGAAIFAPSLIQQVKEDMVANGATPDQANEMGVVVGSAMSALYVIPEFITFRATMPTVARAFSKDLSNELSKQIVTDLTTKQILGKATGTALKVATTGIAQQVIGQAMQNAAVKTVNSNRSVIEGLGDTAIQAAMVMLPLAMLSGGSEYLNMKANLDPVNKAKLDDISNQLQKNGVSKKTADSAAVADMMSTESGKAAIETAMAKTDEEIVPEEPVTPEVAPIEEVKPTEVVTPEVAPTAPTEESIAKVEKSIKTLSKAKEAKLLKLNEKLVTINHDIDNYYNTLEQQEARLEKITDPTGETQADVQESINNLVNNIIPDAELEKSRLEDAKAELLKPKAIKKALAKLGIPPENLPDDVSRAGVVESLVKVLEERSKGIESTQLDYNTPPPIPELQDIGKEPRKPIVPADFEGSTLLKLDQILFWETARRGEEPLITLTPGYSVPSQVNLNDELSSIEDVFKNNPDFEKVLKLGEDKNQQTAKNKLTLYQHMIEAGEATDDDVTKLKSIARKAGISYKKILGTKWDDLNPTIRAKLAVQEIPDGSISFDFTREVDDTRYTMAYLQHKTGLPFYNLYERMVICKNWAVHIQSKFYQMVGNDPGFSHIIKDSKALERVRLILNSRDEGSGVSMPTDASKEEIRMADTISILLDKWKPVVRYMRFIEAYRSGKSINNITKHIFGKDKGLIETYTPEIEEAKKIYEAYGKEALWNYLEDKEWGVMGIYDPRYAYSKKLNIRPASRQTVRGASHLMSREIMEMPTSQSKNILEGFDTYNLSMGMRYLLLDEVKTLNDLFETTVGKWSKQESVRKYLDSYLRELQEMGVEGSLFHSALQRMKRIAYPVIFWLPHIGYRNILQPLSSYPHRAKLVANILSKAYTKLPASTKAKFDINFYLNVDQTGRPMRTILRGTEGIDYKGELPVLLTKAGVLLKPLDTLSNLCAKIPTMTYTDRVSRAAVYQSACCEAWHATERYNIDGDLQKWFDTSGISYLTKEQQEYIMGRFGQETISNATYGLQDTTGQEAACMKIATEVCNGTLYLYDRAQTGGATWGASGRTFGSLMIFPKNTARLLITQLSKAADKELPVEQRLAAAGRIFTFVMAGELLSSFLMTTTGSDKKDYSVLNMLSWNVGGLTLGLMTEVSSLIAGLFTVASGDKQTKDNFYTKLPNEIDRLGNVFVGGFRTVWDIMEVATDEKSGLDIRYMRKVRSLIDSKYTPEEQDKAKRSFLEMFLKVLFNSETPDPDVIEQSCWDIQSSQEQLGDLLPNETYYTLADLGRAIDSSGVPDYYITQDNGFSDLTIFYENCKSSWDAYTKLSSVGNARTIWREEHPDVDAMMVFWGKQDKLIYEKGSDTYNEQVRLINTWKDLYGITNTQVPWVNWETAP